MYQKSTKTTAVADYSSTMEQKPLKKRVSMKNHKSNRNIRRKIFLLFAVFCMCAAKMYAQDVITLKNGTEIKTVVQKVGTTEVEYKQFDNKNGPVYTLKKSEIFMIKYENGSKDVFTDNAAPPATDVKSAPANSPDANQIIGSNPNKLLFSGTVGGPGYTILNSSGKKVSLMAAYSLMEKVPEAFDLYTRGRRKRSAGYSFMVLSFACEIGAIVSSIDAANLKNSDNGYNVNDYNARTAQAYIFMGVGLFLCIPAEYIFLYAGRKDIKKATDLYNNVIDKKKSPDLSLNFGITHSGGIGFTLHF